MAIDEQSCPALARGVRLQTDPITGKPVLLFPEGMLPLDESPTDDIINLCTGTLAVTGIIDSLAADYEVDRETLRREVLECLAELNRRQLIIFSRPPAHSDPASLPGVRRYSPSEPAPDSSTPRRTTPSAARGPNPRPYLLLAEVTHRCPLHCPYCSNPVSYPTGEELSTGEWCRVMREASALGILHAGFSGGEPLQRPDLGEIIRAARAAGLYTNLITSALGFTPRRARELKAAGLDSVQISFQSDQESLADRIAGTSAHAKKLEAARLARELGFPLTVNVVVHRANITRLEQIIALAEELQAERLELANSQFYGWAFRNRGSLLPTRAQIERAESVAQAARERLLGKMQILFVVPDYYSDRPKPCMNGWGSRFLTVNPVGGVLPCPTASEIKELRFDNVRDRPLAWIWSQSEAFNRFRGTEWMPEPCRICEFREVDFGGCRCQAALITGRADVTDPACSLSPYRQTLASFVESIQAPTLDSNPSAPGDWNLAFRQNPGVTK